MKLFTRRRVLGGLGLGGLGLVGFRACLPGWLASGPVRQQAELSSEAQAMIKQAFADVDVSKLVDLHVHLVGLDPELGTWVNPNMQSHLHPLEKLRYEIYLSASGVKDIARADEAYLERLLSLAQGAQPKARWMLLAFDYHVDQAGEEVPELSAFHTSDERVLSLAEEHEEFVACASVHPYRKDALERLEQAAERGAVAVKWLPNAMGIDPASARCDAFYRRMAELGLVLMCHTGIEKAVHAEEHQKYGNPLRLRRALDLGVRTVAAHCASLGESEDLDAGGGKQLPSFDLFLRLMGESQYEGRLYGGLSAVTLVNRDPRVLRELLTREDLHGRLVNGSDYPLPAIDPMISTRLLVWQELLDGADRPALGEIYSANPLLFDYVLKRRLRHSEEGRTHRFAPTAFESSRIFAG